MSSSEKTNIGFGQVMHFYKKKLRIWAERRLLLSETAEERGGVFHLSIELAASSSSHKLSTDSWGNLVVSILKIVLGVLMVDYKVPLQISAKTV